MKNNIKRKMFVGVLTIGILTSPISGLKYENNKVSYNKSVAYAASPIREAPKFVGSSFKTRITQDRYAYYTLQAYNKDTMTLDGRTLLEQAFEDDYVNISSNASLYEQGCFLKELMVIAGMYDNKNTKIESAAMEEIENIDVGTYKDKKIIETITFNQDRIGGYRRIMIDMEVNKVVREANRKFDNDYDKAKYFYDYFKKYKYTEGSQGVYRSIYNKKGNCRDGAMLYNWMSRKAGIPSHLIIGGANTGKRPVGMDKGNTHAWNAIKINGKWIRVDVTSAMSEGGYNGFNRNGDSRYYENTMYGDFRKTFLK